MKKLISSALALSLLLTGCSSGGTGSNVDNGNSGGANDKVYELKISTTQAPNSAIVEGLEDIAKQVEEQTNGGLKISVYPSGQLGVEEDMIDQALQGMGVAVLTDAARMSSYVPDMGIFNMAYFVDSYEEGSKVMETPTFKGWTDELASEAGIHVLTFNFCDGARSFMTNKEVNTPEDLNGQVIRTPGAAPWVNSIESMGATAYALAWGEVYNGIQTKVIDGCEVQLTSAVSSSMYEVTDYLSKTEHITLFNCLITGEKWFNSLPDEYKEILTSVANAAATDNANYIQQLQAELEATLVEKGVTIIEVDKEPFKEGAKTAYEKMGWTELRESIYKEIGKVQ